MERMTRRLLSVALILVASVVVPGSGPASAAPSAPAVTSPTGIARWAGRHFDTAAGAVPKTCTPETCEETVVSVRLAPDFFETHAGAMEFAIRWPSEYDDFDLYVIRPDGSTVESIQSNIGSAESAFDREPMNGDYTVIATPKAVTDSS